MPRGGAVANRRYSEPVIKKETFDSESSTQILNLTSIFSPQSYNLQGKEEPSCQWYVTHTQGLTPDGPTYSPVVEKSPTSRPQVICFHFKSIRICFRDKSVSMKDVHKTCMLHCTSVNMHLPPFCMFVYCMW